MKLAVVIPAWDEEGSIGAVIRPILICISESPQQMLL